MASISSAFLLVFLIVNSVFGDITLFVSETTTNGDGGVNYVNFNTICANDASTAGLSGTWNVLITKTGSRAYDSLPAGQVVKNTAGEQVAADRDALFPQSNPPNQYLNYLDAYILHPDESYPDFKSFPTAPNGIAPNSIVWSGTDSVSTDPSSSNCNDWTSTSGTGRAGTAPNLRPTWLFRYTTNCDTQRNIICFSAGVTGKNVYVLLKDGFKETGWVDGYFVPFWDSDSSNRLFTITSTDVDASSDPSDGDTYQFQNPNGDGLKCNRVSCWFGESGDTFELELVSYDDGADMTIGTLFKGDKYLSYSSGKFSMQKGNKDAALFKF